MKNKLFAILTICTLGISNMYSQKESDDFFTEINKVKTEKKLKSFKKDSTLIFTAENFKYNKAKKEKINKDSLRKILRSQGNFDYNVEYIEYKYFKASKIDKVISKIENENFSKILEDPNYNNIGIVVEKGVLNNTLKIIATKNYIVFDKEFSILIHSTPSGDREYNVVSGTTYINNIYYNTCTSEHDEKMMHSKENDIIINNGNRFEIKVEYTQNKGKAYDIEVIDSNGQIISFIKN